MSKYNTDSLHHECSSLPQLPQLLETHPLPGPLADAIHIIYQHSVHYTVKSAVKHKGKNLSFQKRPPHS